MGSAVMGRAGRSIAVIAVAMLSGCAVYNPYLGTKAGSDICGRTAQTPGLAHACDLRREIHSSRKQYAVTQNWVATGLISLTAVVGYRTARDLSSASTAGLATAGIAGYALSQHLLQPSRLTIYDKADTAISCAIGLYSEGKGRLMLANPDFASVVSAKAVFDEERRALGGSLQEEAQAFLDRMVVYAEFLDRDVTQRATASLDGGLAQATQRIQSEANTAITSTALPITSLSAQVDRLVTATQPPPDSGQRFQPEAAATSVAPTSGPLVKPYAALQLLAKAHDAAIVRLSDPDIETDFTKCSVGVVQVQPTAPQQPFQLGVDNSEDHKVKSLKAGHSVTIQLVGGRAPFAWSLGTGSPEELGVRIVSVGAAATVVVEATEKTKKDLEYVVLIADAAGSLRQFSVKRTE